MSVIAGTVFQTEGPKGEVARQLLAALDFVVAEREAEWNGRDCVLVTKRLVVEPRDATAPLLKPTANEIVVAIEGHLFNRPELAETLGLPATSEDEELVAAAWEKWGDAFPAHLNGEFALAAWDDRRRRLLLAVDHVASVPLYYAHNQSGQVVFATEISAIIAVTGLRPEPDWNKIADHLARSLFDEDRTFLAGISAVPAGSVAVFSREGARVFRYWDYAQIVAPRIAGEEEGIEQFRASLEHAVVRRVPETGAVGAHLTGGLDSSAVAALAANVLGPQADRLNLFSVVPSLPGDGPSGPGDMEYIRAFLRDYPECRHAYVIGFAVDGYPLPGIPNGPTNLQLSGAIETMAKLATNAGCRTILNGYGGETGATYMGAGVYAAALKERDWRWLLAEMNAVSKNWRGRLRWCRRLIGGLRPGFHQAQDLRWKVVQELVQPEFITKYRIRERCYSDGPRPPDPLLLGQMVQFRALQTQGRFKDWAHHGRCRGFRYRYPLLDRELLELVRGLPPTAHVCRGRHRELIRRALDAFLPVEIRERQSKFASLVVRNTAADEELRQKRTRELSPFIRDIVGQPTDAVPLPLAWTPGERAQLARQVFQSNLFEIGRFLRDINAYHECARER